MRLHDIEIDDAGLAGFCHRKDICELLFFGSVTRDNFRPDSDVDVIVSFNPGSKPSLLTFAGLQMELTNLLGRQVHLHTDDMIHPYLRKRIREAAKVGCAPAALSTHDGNGPLTKQR